jgi:hypothetical protein
MDYIQYFLKAGGYINKSNLYNFFISILQHRTKEEVKNFHSMMKIHLGIKETESFLNYLFRKDCNNKILEYVKK